jgi:hypothetical protein
LASGDAASGADWAERAPLELVLAELAFNGTDFFNFVTMGHLLKGLN